MRKVVDLIFIGYMGLLKFHLNIKSIFLKDCCEQLVVVEDLRATEVVIIRVNSLQSSAIKY